MSKRETLIFKTEDELKAYQTEKKLKHIAGYTEELFGSGHRHIIVVFDQDKELHITHNGDQSHQNLPDALRAVAKAVAQRLRGTK